MAKFRPQEAAKFARVSETARHLAAKIDLTPERPKALPKDTAKSRGEKQEFIEIEGASLHNLQIPRVRFPKGALSVVTGVSGAGKSSLVLGTLYTNAARGVAAKGSKTSWLHCDRVTGLDGLTQVFLVDRKKIAKSSVSMPGSYLDVMGELRDIFAAQTDAQVLGLKARDFSLSVEGGRCPECKGKGEISLAMRFLADSRVTCPACKGKRFRANILGVKYLALSIADVLSLTLSEVVETFKNHPKIVSRLTPAVELGLGYLKLGQPTASLSGGEAQRLKLVPHLFKGTGGQRLGEGTLLILDEPTTGLHFEDVGKLSRVLRLLTERKVTVVAIEHNQDIIQSADWTIQIGPGAADLGGRVLFQG
jgi:excinuclease ABC subunit A